MTIVGPNDRGKSAIIRALRWICLNKGRGLIRHGTTKAFVKIDCATFSVKRRRTPQSNSYHCGTETFKAFGTDVPDPVKSKLRIDAINFQNQLDAHFWFSLSPGQVAKEMNAVCDLEVMDRALFKVGGKLRANKHCIEEFGSRRKKLQLERADLKWIVAADKFYSMIEAHRQLCIELFKERQELYNLQAVIDTKQFYIQEDEQLLQRLEVVLKASQHLDKYKSQQKELQTLCDEMEVPSIPPTAGLLKACQRVTELENEKRELFLIVENIETAEEFITSFDEGRCPTCLQPLQ